MLSAQLALFYTTPNCLVTALCTLLSLYFCLIQQLAATGNEGAAAALEAGYVSIKGPSLMSSQKTTTSATAPIAAPVQQVHNSAMHIYYACLHVSDLVHCTGRSSDVRCSNALLSNCSCMHPQCCLYIVMVHVGVLLSCCNGYARHSL
jgi:hypothetical protein